MNNIPQLSLIKYRCVFVSSAFRRFQETLYGWYITSLFALLNTYSWIDTEHSYRVLEDKSYSRRLNCSCNVLCRLDRKWEVLSYKSKVLFHIWRERVVKMATPECNKIYVSWKRTVVLLKMHKFIVKYSVKWNFIKFLWKTGLFCQQWGLQGWPNQQFTRNRNFERFWFEEVILDELTKIPLCLSNLLFKHEGLGCKVSCVSDVVTSRCWSASLSVQFKIWKLQPSGMLCRAVW
jgi:hypothetical protein